MKVKEEQRGTIIVCFLRKAELASLRAYHEELVASKAKPRELSTKGQRA